jgi:hypothetical protein
VQEHDPWDDEEDDVIVGGGDDVVKKPAPLTNAEACRSFGVPRPCRPIASRHDSGPNADENRSLVNVNNGFSSHPACPRL